MRHLVRILFGKPQGLIARLTDVCTDEESKTALGRLRMLEKKPARLRLSKTTSWAGLLFLVQNNATFTAIWIQKSSGQGGLSSSLLQSFSHVLVCHFGTTIKSHKLFLSDDVIENDGFIQILEFGMRTKRL